MRTGKQVSQAWLDGYLNLGAAVVAEACRDLLKDDITPSLDAFIWLITDGPIYLDALGMGDVDVDDFILDLAYNRKSRARLRRILEDKVAES